MGGRNISTTKSGKYMNPTDQARKEARKKELKKNKKQRALVRQSVLKNKNPRGLISEMEHLDRMEYDPINPAPFNIKVMQEKRKKVKETWDQLYRLYTKEQPELAKQMDTLLAEYEKSRAQTITYFESVKETQRVTLDEIPMPDLPSQSSSMESEGPRGILKTKEPLDQPQRIIVTRKPPGPPPGRPPVLSDNEDISDDDDDEIEPAKIPLPPPPTTTATTTTTGGERRRIRFSEPGASVSRWSDHVPTDYDNKAEPEFGTPIGTAAAAVSTQPSSMAMPPPPPPPPPFPPGPRGMRLPPPPPPAAFFAANPNVRVPPNVRPPYPGAVPPNPSRMVRPQHASPNVFSAPPSIIAKPPQTSVLGAPPPPPPGPPSKPSLTFEAKPQIRARQDVTAFVPTTLKMKRPNAPSSAPSSKLVDPKSRFEDPLSLRSRPGVNTFTANAAPSTDDAYETFMKEINQLL